MIRLITLTLSFLAVMMFNGCTPEPDWDDSGTPDDCEAACERIEELGCEGAEGSPGPDEEYGTEDDVPCVEVCRNVMVEGGVSLHPACVAAADNCNAVDACFD
jgi:hypothetical protein